jgi:hypothetical protein
MFRTLLQEALRWIVALGTLAGSGAVIGSTPLFQEATPPLEIELADAELPGDEGVPEVVIEPAQGGVSGLAFHPAIMYRGNDECHAIYTVRGSLKNHGPGVLSDIEITYELPSNVGLGPVTLSPESADSLGTSTPLRITMVVSTTSAWQDGTAEDIQIPLTATAKVSNTVVATATATVYIYNMCPDQVAEEPDNGDGDKDQDEDNDSDLDDGMGISGLAFHPGQLNSGGVCRTTYSAQGSLKNHGPAPMASAVISVMDISAPEGVTPTVTIEPSQVVSLTTSKPHRFTVQVNVDETEWSTAGKGATINVRIAVLVNGDEVDSAEMIVRNQCKGETGKDKKADNPAGAQGKPDKSDKQTGKPEKPEKPEKPSHPLDGPPGQNKDKKNK